MGSAFNVVYMLRRIYSTPMTFEAICMPKVFQAAKLLAEWVCLFVFKKSLADKCTKTWSVMGYTP